MTENNTSIGQIQIADEVIAIIAGTASLEVEGVYSASGSATDSFVEFFGKKNQSKGVRVTADSGEVSIEVDIVVEFGYKVQEVALAVQKKVKSAVETMTGLEVMLVNVDITGIAKNTKKHTTEEE
ncbi:MAG: Asp23/Gls24 family envelope stress response protein [Tyzzerella sp.]|uniref:Asp23/Gls24 family envelope stress response protein n=1 Tax=Candidatus Fimicola merdigallinarum TaxID=2840819 RepID=A0A9D9H375_9FIRM|nr:Asp23/Gls24 family envelope stress response protein [Candidatus Fimicola merdigallinarum]